MARLRSDVLVGTLLGIGAGVQSRAAYGAAIARAAFDNLCAGSTPFRCGKPERILTATRLAASRLIE